MQLGRVSRRHGLHVTVKRQMKLEAAVRDSGQQ
jgi:hypothetical protein